MRILACTDVHVPHKLKDNLMTLKKKHKPDIMVCCGDISIFGQGQEEIMDILASINLPTFLVHGNHDDEDVYEEYCRKISHFHDVHMKTYEFGGYIFFGYGGEGFRMKQPEFEKWSKQVVKELKAKGMKGIFLTHMPVYGTTMDIVWDDSHVGSKSFRNFVKKHSSLITLVMSGHIHEGFKCHDKIGSTALINPGDDGLVIDLE